MVRRQVGDRAGTRSTDVFEHDLDAEITTNLAVVEHRDRPRHLRPIRIVVDMVVPPLAREHLHTSKSLSNASDLRQYRLPGGIDRTVPAALDAVSRRFTRQPVFVGSSSA